jgi:hypothetical protein
MTTLARWSIPALLIGSLFLCGVSRATALSCDTACLKGFADKLVASIVAHDPANLPLSRVYAATENSVPSALGMMVIWRTATAAKSSYYVIDPESAQVFLITTISEGSADTLLFGRLKLPENSRPRPYGKWRQPP